MTPEQAAAFVVAQAACANAEIAAMQQSNDAFVASFEPRGYNGIPGLAANHAPYTANDFRAVIDKYCIGHNAVLQCFEDAAR